MLKVVKNADGVQRQGGWRGISISYHHNLVRAVDRMAYCKTQGLALMGAAARPACLRGSVLVIRFPLALAPLVWMLVLSVYVVLASGLPVWLILQPRVL